jgi:hypothetical protein
MPIVADGPDLDPDHLAKCRASGLSAETIAAAGLYTERSTAALQRLLRLTIVRAPALVLPSRDLGGKRNGYDLVRPGKPVVFPDGREAKYVSPKDLPRRAYFPPGTLEAVRTPGRLLVITEGVFKALACTQAGWPCLSLPGVWGGVAKREDGSRVLAPDLVNLNWRGRRVVTFFDCDPDRKGQVNQAAVVLGGLLAEAGADPTLLTPPPWAPDGDPVKQGLDDFIVRVGGAAFGSWLGARLAEAPAGGLREWGKKLIQARTDWSARAGCALDRSPPGTGKSYADGILLRTLEGYTTAPPQEPERPCPTSTASWPAPSGPPTNPGRIPASAR